MQLQAFHCGIKGVIAIDGRVLLLQREDRWSGTFRELPGGRMEPGEEIAQIEVGPLLHAARIRETSGDVRSLVLLFYRVQADLPEITLSDEHLGYRWATAADLPAPERGDDGVAIFDYTLTAVRLVLQGAVISDRSQAGVGRPRPPIFDEDECADDHGLAGDETDFELDPARIRQAMCRQD